MRSRVRTKDEIERPLWTCEDGSMSAEGRGALNGGGGRREGASYVIPWGTIFPPSTLHRGISKRLYK